MAKLTYTLRIQAKEFLKRSRLIEFIDVDSKILFAERSEEIYTETGNLPFYRSDEIVPTEKYYTDHYMRKISEFSKPRQMGFVVVVSPAEGRLQSDKLLKVGKTF